MNKNIFSPSGTINQTFFIFYHILLVVLYIFGGLGIYLLCAKHNLNPLFFVVIFLFLKLLLIFNYKKRLMDITGNLTLSLIAGILLGLDIALLPFAGFIKDETVSTVVFFAMLILFVIIQPAVVALFPAKGE